MSVDKKFVVEQFLNGMALECSLALDAINDGLSVGRSSREDTVYLDNILDDCEGLVVEDTDQNCFFWDWPKSAEQFERIYSKAVELRNEADSPTE